MEEPVPDFPEIRRYKIGDILAIDSHAKKSMLINLIRIADNEKADVLEVHLPSAIKKRDIPAFTIKRSLPSCPVFYQSNKAEMIDFLSKGENWQMSPYDGDCILR